MVDLLLDSSIRDWVLLPIVTIMVLVGLLRHYAAVMMKSELKTDDKQVRQKMLLQRARLLRENGRYLPPRVFQARRDQFVKGDTGLLNQKVEMVNPMANMMTDPTMMTSMMKNNMLMIVPNMVMLPWLSYFFSGFVIAKMPFPLTSRFRSMLQRDIEMSTLDVTYVTSLSMYFLILFGLRGLFSLLLDEQNEADETALMQQQMGGGGGPAGAQDMPKVFKAEADNLTLAEHRWELERVEEWLLAN
eukprot:EG_transcript_24958